MGTHNCRVSRSSPQRNGSDSGSSTKNSIGLRDAVRNQAGSSIGGSYTPGTSSGARSQSSPASSGRGAFSTGRRRKPQPHKAVSIRRPRFTDRALGSHPCLQSRACSSAPVARGGRCGRLVRPRGRARRHRVERRRESAAKGTERPTCPAGEGPGRAGWEGSDSSASTAANSDRDGRSGGRPSRTPWTNNRSRQRKPRTLGETASDSNWSRTSRSWRDYLIRTTTAAPSPCATVFIAVECLARFVHSLTATATEPGIHR